MKNTEPNGLHTLIELKGCDPDQINNVKEIKKILTDSIKDKDIKILDKKFKEFKPHGLTGFLLLSASHISIHTWPEFKYCTIDIFTCSGEKISQKIKEDIISKIKHENVLEDNKWRGYNHNTRKLPIFSTGGEMEIEILENLYYKKNKYQKIEIVETKEFGKCLIIDDVIQLSEKDNYLYDESVTAKITKDDKNILILGGGDMFVSKYLIKKFPEIESIKVIDIDKDIYESCVGVFHKNKIDKKIKVEFVDVIKYLKKNKDNLNEIDHIIFDLTDDPFREEVENTKIFFEKIIDLIPREIKLSIQTGNPGTKDMVSIYEIIKDILEEKKYIVEDKDVFIPSYGEKTKFLYTKIK